MKKLRASIFVAVIILSATIFTGCTLMTYGTTGLVQSSYVNPQWAPPYYNGARYYYLPDAECYYDLSTREFIYLSQGQWCYSLTFPSLYSNFDLENCFAVVLNVNVYRPWMHHQYYASHYPRYYYRDYYDHCNIPYVRGFNENSRSAVYWKENERHRARSWDDENLREKRQFKYSKDDRQQQKEQVKTNQSRDDKSNSSTNQTSASRKANNQNQSSSNTQRNQGTQSTQHPATTTQTDRSHNTNYYGKPIGNPVKVKKQMQNQTQTQKATRSSSSSSSRK
jgi:hypothetical protein